MLRRGWVTEGRVGFLESNDIRARVVGKGRDDGFREAALEVESEECERKNSLL